MPYEISLMRFGRFSQTKTNKYVVSSDNSRSLLPPRPWCGRFPPPGLLPHRPGCHARGGVRPGPQVCPARAPEAVKRIHGHQDIDTPRRYNGTL